MKSFVKLLPYAFVALLFFRLGYDVSEERTTGESKPAADIRRTVKPEMPSRQSADMAAEKPSDPQILAPIRQAGIANLENQLERVDQDIGDQRALLRVLDQQKEQEKTNQFAGTLEQMTREKAAVLDREILLAQLREELDQKEKSVRSLEEKIQQFRNAGIDTDEWRQAQRRYESELQNLNDLRSRYQNMQVQTQLAGTVAESMLKWQQETGREQLEKEFQEQTRLIQSNLARLNEERQALQKQLQAVR